MPNRDFSIAVDRRDSGETALVWFSDDVRVIQDFTADPDKLTRALRDLRWRRYAGGSTGNAGADVLSFIRPRYRPA